MRLARNAPRTTNSAGAPNVISGETPPSEPELDDEADTEMGLPLARAIRSTAWIAERVSPLERCAESIDSPLTEVGAPAWARPNPAGITTSSGCGWLNEISWLRNFAYSCGLPNRFGTAPRSVGFPMTATLRLSPLPLSSESALSSSCLSVGEVGGWNG